MGAKALTSHALYFRIFPALIKVSNVLVFIEDNVLSTTSGLNTRAKGASTFVKEKVK